MGKIKFYVAASLDGLLSDENGGVDFLTPFQNAGYDYGYGDFVKTIGHVVSGSKTYEQVKDFPEGWNFPNMHSYIFTTRNLSAEGRDDLTFWSDGIPKLTQILRSKKQDTWLLGGAKLAGQFFNENAVDELILSIMPVVLGKGMPLFDGVLKNLPLTLKNHEAFPNGVVQLTYFL